MKPTMRQRLIIKKPKLDANGNVMRDRYSKPITTEQEFKCHTRVHGEESKTLDLRIENARDEIDVMPNVPVDEGLEVEYTTISGHLKKGVIKAITETPNLTGSKIYFRTLIIDG
ncbi:hypothetical protein BUZ49_04090 [Staphylococcus hominis]|uniref:Uncharacterized protein n=2 Tax=Staphylococcus hominis TaxID=1290 RepID=A0A974KXH0_STAHO|nr:hypothetical protein BUZ51_06310 [Staphylococcus hominis]RIO58913.1 hypothetical protein BUZ49_04090 [Staphylococcus hominis]